MNKINIKNRKIFFWCSKPLGLSCLKYLYNRREKYLNLEIIGVCISTRDQVWYEKIKRYAHNNQITVYTDDEKNIPEGDLGICIGFPHKINREIIDKFKNGVINLHFAPLPYYRGSKTLNHAILNGEKKYGVTFHYIDEKLDTGPIIDTVWCELSTTESVREITKKLEKLSFNFYKTYIDKMLKDQLQAIEQNEIISRDNIKPKFYTRASLDRLYNLSGNETFDEMYIKVRALESSKKLPFFEKNGKKIYLSITKPKP